MARASRGPLGLVFLVLAVVALAAVALVPRGVVRTVALGQLVRTGAAELPPGVNDASPRSIHVPGVRAMVSREEQDPAEALLDELVTVVPPGPSTVAVLALAQAVDMAPPAGTTADAPTPDGRGPPTSI